MCLTSPRPRRYALTVVCQSAPGQVAGVAAFLERHRAYVEQFAVYDDPPTSRFFLRAVFRREQAQDADLAAMHEDFSGLAPRLQAVDWRLHDLARPLRVL